MIGAALFPARRGHDSSNNENMTGGGGSGRGPYQCGVEVFGFAVGWLTCFWFIYSTECASFLGRYSFALEESFTLGRWWWRRRLCNLWRHVLRYLRMRREWFLMGVLLVLRSGDEWSKNGCCPYLKINVVKWSVGIMHREAIVRWDMSKIELINDRYAIRFGKRGLSSNG